MDLEAWETALRAAVLRAGAGILSELLSEIGSGHRNQPVDCSCGERMSSRGLRSKPLVTLLGSVEFRRTMLRCKACGAVRYPGDEALDVVGTSRSPGVRRLMARAGSQSTFKEGREDLRIFAGIEVSPKDVERVAEKVGEEIEEWTAEERRQLTARAELPEIGPPIDTLYVCFDGTGVPMIPSARRGRKGKQPDGSARTREAKLGCVFTQTTVDKNGRPVRDPASTTFVGAIETAEQFGHRIYAEAVRRGLNRARRVVVIADGAAWIHNLVQIHFPKATQVLDLYHAREHLSDLSKLVAPDDPKRAAALRERWWSQLDKDEISKILLRARAYRPEEPEIRKRIDQEIGYFETNRKRMSYARYRQEGLFVGSGVIEAGCKTVIGQRLKRSGMEWSVRGANAIIALRCNLISGRFEDYWEQRVA